MFPPPPPSRQETAHYKLEPSTYRLIRNYERTLSVHRLRWSELYRWNNKENTGGTFQGQRDGGVRMILPPPSSSKAANARSNISSNSRDTRTRPDFRTCVSACVRLVFLQLYEICVGYLHYHCIGVRFMATTQISLFTIRRALGPPSLLNNGYRWFILRR
jgi:hypothetical protein